MDNKNFITNEMIDNEPSVIKCRECGNEFTIDAEEKAWYRDKNYDIPQRCPECRKKRRKMRKPYGNNDAKKLLKELVTTIIDKGVFK